MIRNFEEDANPASHRVLCELFFRVDPRLTEDGQDLSSNIVNEKGLHSCFYEDEPTLTQLPALTRTLSRSSTLAYNRMSSL